MNKMKNEIYLVLFERAYVRVITPMVQELFMNGKPLMDSTELTEYLRENIHEILNEEEKEQLIKSQIPYYEKDNDIINDGIINLTLFLLANDLISKIKQVINSKKFAGDNPHDPIKNPQMFMMWKFYDEEMGVKLNTMEGSGNAVDS